MNFDIAELLVWLLVFVFSTTCHEAAHAWAAWRGGDSTAYEGGQVSLDPFPHIRREPMGMIVVPLASFLLLGWMMGWASAPYNPEWARRHPQRHALMSLAGPGANFALMIVAFVAIKGLMASGILLPAPVGALTYSNLVEVPGGNIGSTMGAVAMVLNVTLVLNLVLGIFNLMPLPPLDGASVLEGLAPSTVGRFFSMLREQPMFSLIGLLIALHLFGYIVSPAIGVMALLLYG